MKKKKTTTKDQKKLRLIREVVRIQLENVVGGTGPCSIETTQMMDI